MFNNEVVDLVHKNKSILVALPLFKGTHKKSVLKAEFYKKFKNNTWCLIRKLKIDIVNFQYKQKKCNSKSEILGLFYI